MAISPGRSYQKGGAQYKHPRNSHDFHCNSLSGNMIVKLIVEGGLRL